MESEIKRYKTVYAIFEDPDTNVIKGDFSCTENTFRYFDTHLNKSVETDITQFVSKELKRQKVNKLSENLREELNIHLYYLGYLHLSKNKCNNIIKELKSIPNNISIVHIREKKVSNTYLGYYIENYYNNFYEIKKKYTKPKILTLQYNKSYNDWELIHQNIIGRALSKLQKKMNSGENIEENEEFMPEEKNEKNRFKKMEHEEIKKLFNIIDNDGNINEDEYNEVHSTMRGDLPEGIITDDDDDENASISGEEEFEFTDDEMEQSMKETTMEKKSKLKKEEEIKSEEDEEIEKSEEEKEEKSEEDGETEDEKKSDEKTEEEKKSKEEEIEEEKKSEEEEEEEDSKLKKKTNQKKGKRKKKIIPKKNIHQKTTGKDESDGKPAIKKTRYSIRKTTKN